MKNQIKSFLEFLEAVFNKFLSSYRNLTDFENLFKKGIDKNEKSEIIKKLHDIYEGIFNFTVVK